MLEQQREQQKDQAEAELKMAKTKIDVYRAETERLKLQVEAQLVGAKIDNTQADTLTKIVDAETKHKESQHMELEKQTANNNS